jgi:hypothetical protein
MLGYQSEESLPFVAADALARGLDSPSLRVAAGDPSAARFRDALTELGVPAYEEQEALWRLARHYAEQIVSREIDPLEGARSILGEVAYEIEREGDFRIFIGILSEFDDYPAGRDTLSNQAVVAAGDLLGRQQPRRWLLVQAAQGHPPTWTPDPRQSLDPADLPIDEALRSDLIEWSSEFDALLERGINPGWGFKDPAEAETFVERGRQLVHRLQVSLGDGWHVEYMQAPTRPYWLYPPK